MLVPNATPATLPYATPSHSMQERLRQEQADARRNPGTGPVEQRSGTDPAPQAGRVNEVRKPNALTPEEAQQVKHLKKRDAEVRRHEQTHLAAAGSYGKGPPHYDYQTGPDGRRYAVGGHVKIDTRPIPGDPEATLAKARILKRAALAPADPSSQDRRVAGEAARMEVEARKELGTRNKDTADTHPGTKPRAPEGASAPEGSSAPEGASTPEGATTLTVSTRATDELRSDPSIADKIKGRFFILVSHQGNWQGIFGIFPSRHIDRYA